MVIRAKRAVAVLALLILAAAGIFGVKYAADYFYRRSYPLGYEELVRKYAAEYEIDPHFVWAVIKTESNFKPDATSNVGARGLMQIMEDTFHWIDTKLPDSGDTYDDMYTPEENIRYGAYLLSYLYREFGSYDTVAAAYHAGRTAVGKWLRDGRYSADGRTLDEIPIGDTDHYVGKVMRCFEMYQKLYAQ